MPVDAERCGRVLIVTMRREAKRNAIDREMALGIDAALNELDDDPDLWAGVITGTAAVFSAGTDLSGGQDAVTERGGEYGIIRRNRTTPLIAAVEGWALGGGFEIALACDLIVAARTARFGLPEVQRGLVASSGALFRAPRALPPNVAKELLLTGGPLDPERAYLLGVVNLVTEPGEALAEAVRLAETICANGPVAVRASLAAINRLVAADDDEGWQATAEAVDTILASEDRQEGINAFFEKRAPRWAGR
ncbi:enoyl-CoA hydratase-related protein [Frankia sp. Cppng1_Ct_nod]|uniref:enoyl-CoA hydratase-related protein n=1 Tax=Frankia sp. Cppng1_Ct_nod TaxID=2897162 RepID=UPI0024E068FA|nr:enoyl-CoA hydratase-related protein [Frankia sp. Cppng1_Ct_nod]